MRKVSFVFITYTYSDIYVTSSTSLQASVCHSFSVQLPYQAEPSMRVQRYGGFQT